MKTVWVIEQGDYSDYRVVGVFTSKDNAQKMCDVINADDTWADASIDEWVLDPCIEELNAGMSQYFVMMLRNGDVESVVERGVASYDLSGSVDLWKRVNKPWALGVRVWANDEQHAVKIANEKRVGMLAAGEWKENV